MVLLVLAGVLGLLLRQSIKESEQLKKDMTIKSYQIEDLTEYLYEREQGLLEEIQAMSNSKEEMTDAVSNLATLCKEAEEQIEALEDSLNANNLILNDYDIFTLKEYDIDDTDDILDDLFLQTDLIESEPVLGGTMRFVSAYMISKDWVIGSFEDGHLAGVGIYQFEVLDNTDITWRIIVEEMY